MRLSPQAGLAFTRAMSPPRQSAHYLISLLKALVSYLERFPIKKLVPQRFSPEPLVAWLIIPAYFVYQAHKMPAKPVGIKSLLNS